MSDVSEAMVTFRRHRDGCVIVAAQARCAGSTHDLYRRLHRLAIVEDAMAVVVGWLTWLEEGSDDTELLEELLTLPFDQ